LEGAGRDEVGTVELEVQSSTAGQIDCGCPERAAGANRIGHRRSAAQLTSESFAKSGRLGGMSYNVPPILFSTYLAIYIHRQKS
jgi:hypothetical protein